MTVSRLRHRLSGSAAALLERLGGASWEKALKERTLLRPRLSDLREGAQRITTVADDVLGEVLTSSQIPRSTVQEEFRTVEEVLEDRLHRGPLRFPENWAANSGTLLVLYGLVRAVRPETVVETGVANGVSSLVLLQALSRNGHGRLVSFDTSSSAGGILGPEERGRWTLHVLPAAQPGPALTDVLATLPTVDLAFLDADHSYPGQTREYEAVRAKLRPGAWLVSDDVDWSYAFLDFCGRAHTRPTVLVSESKASGFVRLPQTDTAPPGAAPAVGR